MESDRSYCPGPPFTLDDSAGSLCEHGQTSSHVVYEAAPEPRTGNRITEGVMSFEFMDWETPDYLYDALNEVFNFGFDAAAIEANTKHPFYLTPDDDALETEPITSLATPTPISWFAKIKKKYDLYTTINFRNCAFLNPPYGDLCLPFMRMSHLQHKRFGSTVAVLCAGRLETDWFGVGNDHARYRLELDKRVVFNYPGCPEGMVPVRETIIVNGQKVKQIVPGQFKKSQPAFPSTVIIYTNEKLPQLYKLQTLGLLIDLEVQRKINAGRRRNGDGRERNINRVKSDSQAG